MKIYDERFNEQQQSIKKLYYEEKKNMLEISGIVKIPIGPLKRRMHQSMKLRKYPISYCDICKKYVHSSCYKKHKIAHCRSMRDNLRCQWCNSPNVVYDGFSRRKDWKKQSLLCRECDRSTFIDATGSSQWHQ